MHDDRDWSILDRAAELLVTFTQNVFRFSTKSDVARDRGTADHVSDIIPDRGKKNLQPDPSPVFAHADRIVNLHALALFDLLNIGEDLLKIFGQGQHGQRTADYLVCCKAIY